MACKGDRRGAYRVLTGRSETKRQLGRPRSRRKCSIKMHLQEVGWGGMDWIDLAQYRVQLEGACECGNEPAGSLKCGEFLV